MPYSLVIDTAVFTSSVDVHEGAGVQMIHCLSKEYTQEEDTDELSQLTVLKTISLGLDFPSVLTLFKPVLGFSHSL